MPLPTPPPPPPPPKTPFPTPSTHQTPEMTRNLDHHHHKQQQSIHNNPAPQPPPPQQQQSDPMSFVRQLREQRRLSMLDNDDDESDDWITHSSRDDIIFSILQKHDSSTTTTTTQQCRPPRKRPSQDLGTHPRRHSAPLTAQLAQNPPQKPFLDHHHHHLYTSAINTLLASRIINPLNLISQVLVNATMSSAAAYHHHHTSSSSSSNNNSPLQENEDKNVGTVADLSSPKSNEPLKRLRELKLDEMVVVGGGGIISRRSAFEKDRFERMIGFGAASCAKQEDPPPAPPPPATDNQKRRKQHNNNQATPPPQSSQPHSLSDLQAQVMQIVCDMVTCAKRDVSNVEEAETLLIMLVERCWHSLIILFMVERHIDPEVIDRESKRIEAGDERTELEVLFERAKILAAKDKEVFRLVRKWILFNSGCPKLRPQRQKCSLELAAHSKNIHQNGLARYARIARFMPAIAQLQQQTVKSLVWDSIFDGTDVVLLIDHLCSL